MHKNPIVSRIWHNRQQHVCNKLPKSAYKTNHVTYGRFNLGKCFIDIVILSVVSELCVHVYYINEAYYLYLLLCCSVTMSALPYAIVEFQNGNKSNKKTFDIIPTSWFSTPEEDECHWPKAKGKVLDNLIKGESCREFNVVKVFGSGAWKSW